MMKAPVLSVAALPLAAAQDLGTYQLRPTLSDEGDLVIELFAVVQSTVVVRAEQGIAGWVYEIRDALNRAAPGVGWSWYSIIYNDAASTLTSLRSAVQKVE